MAGLTMTQPVAGRFGHRGNKPRRKVGVVPVHTFKIPGVLAGTGGWATGPTAIDVITGNLWQSCCIQGAVR